MSMQASLWFNQRMKRFPATQDEDWMSRIQRTAKKLLDVFVHLPAEFDPSGKLSSAPDSGNE
jgi:hypothetical protein